MSNEIPNGAYKYAAAFYFTFGAYVWYVFNEVGKFLAQYMMPPSVSSYAFSVNNPNFPVINRVLATIITLILVYILFSYQRLREYTVDVGDELTRVSWTEVKNAQKATAIVIALATVSALFLFVADVIFIKIVNLIMSTATNS